MSGDQPDYSIRPAKSVERRMLAETIAHVTCFGPVSNYRYLGFGWATFVDFMLFHKRLGIRDMISMEHRPKLADRIKFNKPLDCIAIEMEKSTTTLAKIPWTNKTILWLDYEGVLEQVALADTNLFATNAVEGSIIILSVNSSKLATANSTDLQVLSKNVGKTRIDPAWTEDQARTALHVLYNELFKAEINRCLTGRNGTTDDPLVFRQLFFFRYRDGAPMLTLGGIVLRESQVPDLELTGVFSLDWVKDQPFDITVPILTAKERRELQAQMPGTRKEDVRPKWLAEEFWDQYFRTYRFASNFVDADI